MSGVPDVPYLVLIRVLTPGGPYSEGQILSLAFSDPTIGRVCSHGAPSDAHQAELRVAGLVPESISVAIVSPAGAYKSDDILTLSFVNPALVRIHPPPTRETFAIPVPPRGLAATELRGVVVRSRWSGEAARRFVAVIDKLFTVDRLGWYRHSLAMRMLLPDELVLPDPDIGMEAGRQLASLRSAATEALGGPLLAALVPQFAIDSSWLESIETPTLAKALAGVRESVAPHITVELGTLGEPDSPDILVGTIRFAEYQAARNEGADAFIPLLIPQRSTHEVLSQRLREYRSALLELFGQTARTSTSVRLKQMTIPNHVLDDRLWNLAGALQDAFDDRTVA